VLALPARLADALGMAALYILDHVDRVGGEGARAIAAQLNRSLFVIADESARFPVNAVVNVETESAVAAECRWALGIGRAKMEIGQMGGCPAFVAAFVRICEELEEDRRRPIPPVMDAAFVAKAEIARRVRAEHAVRALVLDVAGAMPRGVAKSVVDEALRPGFELKLLPG
jgi:hypothetical protein